MIESLEGIEIMINSPIFKWTVGTVVTTLVGLGIADLRNTRKKIKDAPTKDDLAKVKNESFKYTDARMKVHEDLQLLELTGIKDKINETHSMVKLLHEIAIKKGTR